jgi:hypothetical protein
MGNRSPLSIVLLFAILIARPVYAQHEAQGQANSSQNYISHADVALTANALPVAVLGLNSNRVTAICQMVGTIGTNTARVGDSSIGASQGTQLSSAIPAVTLDITGSLYVYSATGATVNCAEIVRGN